MNSDEIFCLHAELAEATAHNRRWFCGWCGKELVAVLSATRDALRDLVGSPAEFDDARCTYLTVQVDRVTADNARLVCTRADALLAQLDVRWSAVAERPADSRDNPRRP